MKEHRTTKDAAAAMHCNLKVARRRALVLGFYCEAYNAAFKLNTSATSAEPQCTGTSNFSAIGQYAVSYNDLKMGNFGAVRQFKVNGPRYTHLRNFSKFRHSVAEDASMTHWFSGVSERASLVSASGRLESWYQKAQR